MAAADTKTGAGAGAGAEAGSLVPSTLKVGFIGAGMMASAIISGFVKKSIVQPENIMVSHPSASFSLFKEDGLRVTSSNAEVVEFADVIVLATKPHLLGSAVAEAHAAISEAGDAKLYVSIAAGLMTAKLETLLGTPSARVIRVMPNTPCLVGEAACAMCPGTHATSGDMNLVEALFKAVGIIVRVTESQMDAVTGLAGSGPAYVFMMVEALADGGVRAGLPRPLAMKLATQMVKGASTMVQTTGLHPGVLKDQVCSAGGTTIAGVHALENGGFRSTVMNAVYAAAKRSKELQ